MAPPEPQIAALDRLGASLLASFEGPRPRERLRVAMATALALAVVATFIVATAPGRAVAEWVGDLIGIGDQPTVQRNRDAVVIGVGEQSAFHYEIVATGDEGPETARDRVEPCVTVEFPAFEKFVAGACLTGSLEESLARTNIAQPAVVGLFAELYPEAEVMVQGLASPAVESVDVHYTDFEGHEHVVAAGVDYLGEPLSSRIGISAETKSYVAFLPPDLLAPPATENAPLTASRAAEALERISVTALNADGGELGRVDHFTGRTAALGFALRAPEARFAGHAELAERCRSRLPQSADGDDVEFCVFAALQ